MLCCLTKPSAGDAVMLGKSITKQPDEVKAFIAVSPQETAVAPKLSVKENLELMAGIHGANAREAREKAAAMAERFGLTGVMGKAAGKLSGGWQRRLSIAMALILEPKILFLDEPTLGLDVLARAELWEQIRKLKGEITVILTTHYMEEAESLSDRIGVMNAGRLIRVGTAQELREATGTASLEEAFIALAKEAAR